MRAADKLGAIRAAIDICDDQIVRLLLRRARLALAAGEIKRAQAEPIHDPDREAAVLRRVRRMAGGPLDAEAVTGFYRALITACRRLEEGTADSGPPAPAPAQPRSRRASREAASASVASSVA